MKTAFNLFFSLMNELYYVQCIYSCAMHSGMPYLQRKLIVICRLKNKHLSSFFQRHAIRNMNLSRWNTKDDIFKNVSVVVDVNGYQCCLVTSK